MTDLPCIEPKPDRTPKEFKFSVCRCGHYKFEHSLGFFYHAKCDKCMCNKYKHLGNFTYSEKKQLKPCSDEK